jgi:peptide maturation system acyl carrier-related protein
MTFDKIIQKLKNLFLVKFKIEPSEWDDEKVHAHLLGPLWNFRARHLIYLLAAVESEFDILISEESVIKGDFSSFTSISRLIAGAYGISPNSGDHS